MHKWKRVETDDGPRFRSALALHESALLRSLANSILGMLDARESSSPPDELELITGMRTGNTAPPEDATMRRLLPDFHRSGDGSDDDAMNSALRSLHEPAIIDALVEAGLAAPERQQLHGLLQKLLHQLDVVDTATQESA